MIAESVVIRELESHAEGVRWDSFESESFVVAASKEGIGISGMLVDLYTSLLAGSDEDFRQRRVVEARDGQPVDLRAFIVVRAAHMLQIHVGDRFVQRKHRIRGIVTSSEQAFFFT